MSFTDSIQMIFFSILACTIGSQVGPNKMAATVNVSLASLSEQWKLNQVFFFRSVVFSAPPPCYKKRPGWDTLGVAQKHLVA